MLWNPQGHPLFTRWNGLEELLSNESNISIISRGGKGHPTLVRILSEFLTESISTQHKECANLKMCLRVENGSLEAVIIVLCVALGVGMLI